MPAPTITALPDPPTRANPDEFNTKADAFLGAMPDFVDEANALGEYFEDKTAEVEDLVASAGYTGTSTTEVTVGVGSKTFTTQANLSYRPGVYVLIADSAAPTTNKMVGAVTAYNSTTGVLAVTVEQFDGSGTIDSWTISLSGPPGSDATVTQEAIETALGGPVVLTVNGVEPDGSGDVVVTAGQDVAVQFGIALARLTGSQQGFADGYADDFQDTDGVDAAASTGELYVSTGTKGYRGRTTSTLPTNMTSNTAPSPYVASASRTFGAGFEAYRAFDSDASGTYWCPPDTSVSDSITIDLGSTITITSYSIRTPTGGDGGLTGWYLDGSTNGSSWTELDYRVNQTITSGATYTPATPGAYRYYRVRQAGIQTVGNYGCISDLRITGYGGAVAMSLRSTAWSVSTAPTTMSLAVLASTASGSIVAGTNLRGYVSRDDGTTWTEVTLTAQTDGAGITTYQGSADVSGQPSGTSLKWRVDTTTDSSADILIDAVVLQRK